MKISWVGKNASFKIPQVLQRRVPQAIKDVFLLPPQAIRGLVVQAWRKDIRLVNVFRTDKLCGVNFDRGDRQGNNSTH